LINPPPATKILPLGILISSLLASGTACAAPTGGEVSAGQATIAQQGNITNIQQSSQNAAINWQGFSTAPQETVNFYQPNADAVTLNRVLGNERSVLEGAMNANGHVFIQNPNGVLIGKDAQINVGGLVATTARISDEDFMAGNYRFDGAPGGSVKNLGNITVPPGGTVALIAPVVANSGTIRAPQGKALLASAEAFRITLPGDNFAYTLERGTLQGLVDNGGAILTDGGHVVLTALGTDAVKKSIIRHSGNIEANTVRQRNGKVELLGDLDNSELQFSGSIKAEAPQQGDGGFVETSAARLKIADSAQVSTEAKNGKTGEWLIDPQDFNIRKTDGDMTGAKASESLKQNNLTLKSADGKKAGKGNVNIIDEIDWNKNTLTLNAENDINIFNKMSGSGEAKLKLEYGQASADGGESEVKFRANGKIDLPAGRNLTVQKGNAGTKKEFDVIHEMPQGERFSRHHMALGKDMDVSYTANLTNFSGWMFPTANNNALWGLGHEVKGLTIKTNKRSNAGLVGTMHYGVVRDLKVTNFDISANNANNANAGGVVGYMEHGELINVHATGKIKNSYVAGGIAGLMDNGLIHDSSSSVDIDSSGMDEPHSGGLAGEMRDSVIKESISSGRIYNNDSYDPQKFSSFGGLVGSSVSDNNKIMNSSSSVNISARSNGGFGGIVGKNSADIDIKNSHNSGNINVLGNKAVAGGLIGYDFGDSTTISGSYATGNVNNLHIAGGLIGNASKVNIENSYFSGNVSGNVNVGGLVGDIDGLYSLINIKDSYVTGKVDGNAKTGGLVGSVEGSIHIRNSYFNNETTGQTVAVSGRPASVFQDASVTTAEMKQKDLYGGWDPTVWDIKDGAYPKLRPYDRTSQQNNPGGNANPGNNNGGNTNPGNNNGGNTNPGNNNGGNTNPGNNNGGNNTPPNNNNAGNNSSNNQSNNSQQAPNRTYGPAEANYVNPNKRQQPDNKPKSIEQPAKPKPVPKTEKPQVNNTIKPNKDNAKQQQPIIHDDTKRLFNNTIGGFNKIGNDINNWFKEGASRRVEMKDNRIKDNEENNNEIVNNRKRQRLTPQEILEIQDKIKVSKKKSASDITAFVGISDLPAKTASLPVRYLYMDVSFASEALDKLRNTFYNIALQRITQGGQFIGAVPDDRIPKNFEGNKPPKNSIASQWKLDNNDIDDINFIHNGGNGYYENHEYYNLDEIDSIADRVSAIAYLAGVEKMDIKKIDLAKSILDGLIKTVDIATAIDNTIDATKGAIQSASDVGASMADTLTKIVNASKEGKAFTLKSYVKDVKDVGYNLAKTWKYLDDFKEELGKALNQNNDPTLVFNYATDKLIDKFTGDNIPKTLKDAIINDYIKNLEQRSVTQAIDDLNNTMSNIETTIININTTASSKKQQLERLEIIKEFLNKGSTEDKLKFITQEAIISYNNNNIDNTDKHIAEGKEIFVIKKTGTWGRDYKLVKEKYNPSLHGDMNEGIGVNY